MPPVRTWTRYILKKEIFLLKARCIGLLVSKILSTYVGYVMVARMLFPVLPGSTPDDGEGPDQLVERIIVIWPRASAI